MNDATLIDRLERVKNKLRFVQELLCAANPDDALHIGAEGVSGLYMLLEEAEDALMEAREAIVNA